MESGTGTGAGTCTVEGVNTGQSDVVAMEMDVFSGEEVDSNPIPVARCRANTWHGRPILSVKEENSAEGAACGGKDGDLGPDGDAGADGVDTLGATEGSGGWRKGTTRRNAWGNLSYADLITKAIESAPEKRMTLSQIYGWMVQNISFFKDKGESNSSAGWKASISGSFSGPAVLDFSLVIFLAILRLEGLQMCTIEVLIVLNYSGYFLMMTLALILILNDPHDQCSL